MQTSYDPATRTREYVALVVVFSCVSLIYLTVAIYTSYRAFRSGFDERPIMCQTINTSTENNWQLASWWRVVPDEDVGLLSPDPRHRQAKRHHSATPQLHQLPDVLCPPVNPTS
ncbi:hypothetical protein NQ318_020672 [Aromia moschata]|uniref:Uncharacterized protein n=1 Tax=Aromia moschata TaxID=1265417 RepID=A0AAV8XWU6_9CUCU|nr:hypothetical protein NQ318_020672 [Aromia moschata]